MFPEGALKHNTGLIGFRTGAFQAAAQAGIPVIPVALRGVRSVLRDQVRAEILRHCGEPDLAPGPA